MKLRIKNSSESIAVTPGETVKDTLDRAGYFVPTPCNGKGICGRCCVRAEGSDLQETPHPRIAAADAARGVRLACRLVPESDLVIELLPGTNAKSETNAMLMGGDGTRVKATNEWPRDACSLGLGIDLGTTTVVASLVSLSTGQVLSTRAILNPQIRFGHDVITRIEMGSSVDGLATLADAIRRGLNQLTEETCAEACQDQRSIHEVVIGGNTTMLQLAAKIDPEPLGKVPFTVGIEGGKCYRPETFGLSVDPECRVYVPPVFHAFAGSDVSAGLFASAGFFNGRSSTLFLDVGTNGELALSAHGQQVTTSTAAGPAFEGMGLSCGMIAQPGAIEAAWIDGDRLRIQTVDEAPAVGICGSGVVDLVAALYQLGVIDQSGAMCWPDETDELPSGLARRVEEVAGSDSADTITAFRVAGDVYLTQEDVRQVQLAKAAVQTAIEMLLEEVDISSADRTILAGGFGQTLRPESMGTIGMLPAQLWRRVSPAGNTSLQGCVAMLGHEEQRQQLEERTHSVLHLMLAERPDYMDRYVENIGFPPLTASLREPGEVEESRAEVRREERLPEERPRP